MSGVDVIVLFVKKDWFQSLGGLPDMVFIADWQDDDLVQLYATALPTAAGMGFNVELLEHPEITTEKINQGVEGTISIPCWIPAFALVGAFDLTQARNKAAIGFTSSRK